MTVVDTRTGEIIERPTYGEVKASIESAKASLEAAAEQIVWQIETRAWEVLGYADWNTMRETEYGGAAFMVPRAERPELVARMRRSGLTQVQIAETAGVSVGTVNADLTFSSENDEPSAVIITNVRGQQRPASYTKTPAAQAHETDPQDGAHGEDPARRDLAEFPDLTYFAETGRASDVPLMASDLRRYRDNGELPERLDTLRRSIAVDKSKRDGTYRPTPLTPAASVCPTCGQNVKE